MSAADGIVVVNYGDEPDGEWENELVCSVCGHFHDEDKSEDIFWFHDQMPYCGSCYEELGVYPSEDYWDNFNFVHDDYIIEDEGAYFGEDKI